MNYLAMRNPIPRASDDAGAGGAGTGADGAAGGAADAGAGAGGDAGGGQPAAFYESFADADLKTHPSVHRYTSVEELARGYVNLEKRFGVPAERLLTLPEKLDDAEGLKAIYAKLGAPETPDGYKIELEGATDADKATLQAFLKDMHAAGPFPPQFMSAAAAWWKGQVSAAEQAAIDEAKAAQEAGTAELKTAWGAAFDQRSQEVGQLLADLGGQPLVDELNASGLGNNPKLAQFLAKIVDLRAEGGPTADTSRADLPGRTPTPAQAMARARELEAHPALMDRNHPQHAAVVADRQKMLVLASGQTPA